MNDMIAKAGRPEPTRTDDVEYVQALLRGDVKASNPYAQDVVVQLRDADNEINQLRGNIERTSVRLEQMRHRMIALNGVAQQLSINLVRWRDTPTAGQEPPEVGWGETKE